LPGYKSRGGHFYLADQSILFVFVNFRQHNPPAVWQLTATAITALAAATTTAVNAVRQEMNERFAQVDQKFDHSLPPKRGR
jgi:hypothetical protein